MIANTKYKLTPKTNRFGEFQIQALTSFGNVKKGDFGGFIAKEANLATEGNAWVYDNARVFGNAKVHGNAKVYGDANVCGDASVAGDVEVSIGTVDR